MPRARAVAAAVANNASAIAIIFVNKSIFSVYGFPYSAALMIVHMGATGAALWAAALLHPLEGAAPLWSAMRANAVLHALSVALSTMALRANAVVVSQVCKALTPLVMVALEFALDDRAYGAPVYAALAATAGGSVLATAGRADVTAGGLALALAAPVAASLYHRSIKAVARATPGATPVARVMHQSPLSVVCLAWLSLCMDPWAAPFAWGANALTVVAASAALALVFNVTQFAFIEAFSPLTFVVVGNARSALVMLAGALFWDAGATVATYAGIALATLGALAYGVARSDGAPPTTDVELARRGIK